MVRRIRSYILKRAYTKTSVQCNTSKYIAFYTADGAEDAGICQDHTISENPMHVGLAPNAAPPLSDVSVTVTGEGASVAQDSRPSGATPAAGPHASEMGDLISLETAGEEPTIAVSTNVDYFSAAVEAHHPVPAMEVTRNRIALNDLFRYFCTQSAVRFCCSTSLRANWPTILYPAGGRAARRCCR